MNLSAKLHFTPAEKITVLYMLLSFILMFFVGMPANKMLDLLFLRVGFLAVMLLLVFLDNKLKYKMLYVLRAAFVLALLSYWYPETFEINRYVGNYDHWLAWLDQVMFGFQPAVAFAQHFPGRWIAELMNLGYSSYFVMIAGTLAFYFFRQKKYFMQYFFVLMFAFFVYYLFYILFPASGPQFYYAVIGKLQVSMGVFPQIGTYFNTHAFAAKTEPGAGVFHRLVELTQKLGERPTAAFPSSHVGISTLILLLVIKNKDYILAAVIIPFYIFLVMATVYIQAHFLVDVLAGIISSVILLFVGLAVYPLFCSRKVVSV